MIIHKKNQPNLLLSRNGFFFNLRILLCLNIWTTTYLCKYESFRKGIPWNIKTLVQFFFKIFYVGHNGLFLIKNRQNISKKRRVNTYVCMYVYVHQLLIKVLKINGTSSQAERNHDDSLWWCKPMWRTW
jgi:hypothetical protein